MTNFVHLMMGAIVIGVRICLITVYTLQLPLVVLDLIRGSNGLRFRVRHRIVIDVTSTHSHDWARDIQGRVKIGAMWHWIALIHIVVVVGVVCQRFFARFFELFLSQILLFFGSLMRLALLDGTIFGAILITNMVICHTIGPSPSASHCRRFGALSRG